MATKTRAAKLVKCTCEICGKEFMWKKHVTICQEKSTCRVLKHQRKQAQEKLNLKATMMSMDAVIVMNTIIDHAPEMKPFIEAFMSKHEPLVTEDMLIVVYNAIGLFTPLQ